MEQERKEVGFDDFLEMEQKQIINNAFKFLARKDLVIINKVITYPFLNKIINKIITCPFLDKKDLENNSVYEMYVTRRPSDNKTYMNICYKSEWDSILEVRLDYNKDLTDLFNKTYIMLAEKQQPR